MSAARLILTLVTALAVVTGVGYLASQTILAPPRVPTTTAAMISPYGVAPSPVRARQAVPAGEPLGVPALDDEWARTTAASAGIPEAALRAYARATMMVSKGCRLGWPTLAGIGWVESQHGTIDDRRLLADGRSSTPILGPALDGRGKLAAMRATPRSAQWHGNPQWERAVGPMQFIPSTWGSWSSDGDGDGTADPNDLDDAALAAARYLCAGGQDLSTGAGWRASIYSYNHARVYVDAVFDAAWAYAERTR